MIRGLYEAHLPVRDLNRSIEFYEGLGLQLDHNRMTAELTVVRATCFSCC